MNDKTKKILNNFELYIGTIAFFILTVLLMLQVISRYLLKYSFTWMEELATIMYVWMIYCGVSAAVTKRKHLRIDFILNIVPFRLKKAMLIMSNVIFAVFNVYITMVMINVIGLQGDAKTTMLRIPYKLVYCIIPIMLLLSVVRLVQDTIQLNKENEENLGVSAPSMDLDAAEARFKAKAVAKAAGQTESEAK